MKWQDRGFVIAARRHGESSIIIDALTAQHGRHAGYVRGGGSGGAKRLRGILTRGNLVYLAWQARLDEHLGNFQAELETAHTARMMDDAVALNGLESLCALALALPERAAAPVIFARFASLLDMMPQSDRWRASYVRFELALLAELGFGLDLTPARGAAQPFISAEGKVVTSSLSAQQAKEQRLARLPIFLLNEAGAAPKDISDGLRLTGWFLRKRIYEPRGESLPAARQRFAKRLRIK